MKLKILLAEDHPLFLAGMKGIIASDKNLSVVASAVDGKEAISMAREFLPDIVIMDVSMPNIDGIEATRQIIADAPETKIIALSIHTSKRFVKKMINAGAMGYLVKDNAPDELAKAIWQVHHGEQYFSPMISDIVSSNETITESTRKSDILNTKLYRPKLSKSIIFRSQLVQRLESNKNKPLSLISAGAGYGKSVTVSQWLDTTKSFYCWISLDDENNEVRMFLTYLKEALENVFPGKLSNIANIIQGGEFPAISLIAKTLINELDTIKQPFIVVLDDFHKIIDREVIELVNHLIKFPPEMMHLCIITRRDPDLNLSKLKAQNRLTEIRMTDLAFTIDEIGILAKQIRNLNLHNSTAEILFDKTEGWAVGICLSILSLEENNAIEELNTTLLHNMQSSSDYLVEEVLAAQHPWVKDLLILSSVLNRFSSELINEIIDCLMLNDEISSDGQEFIEKIQQANLFAIALDQHKQWFRLHHLFQELLQNQLKKNYPEAIVTKLHLIASNWFEKKYFIEEAIYHAVQVKDLALATLIINRNRERVVNNDKWYLLESWLAMIPEDVINGDPGLLMARSWVLLHRFQFETVFEKLALVEALCINKDLHSVILGEVAMFKGYMLFLMGDGVNSLPFLKIALSKLPYTYFEARAQAEIIYAMALQMNGNKQNGIAFLDDLFENPKPSNTVRDSRLLINYVFIHLISADLEYALKANQRLEKAIEGDYAYVQAWNRHMYGLIYVHQLDFDKAIENLIPSVNDRFIYFRRAAVDSIICLAIAHQCNNQSQKANNTLRILREFVEAINDPAYHQLLHSAELRLKLMQGNYDQALIIKNKIILPENEPAMIWWFDIISITYCRGLIAEDSKNSIDQAASILAQQLEVAKAHSNTIHTIEILVLKAIVEHKRNRPENAYPLLREALELAEPSKIKLAFIEPGQFILPLLIAYCETTDNRFAYELIENLKNTPIFKISNKARTNTQSKRVLPKNDEVLNLSARELEIAKLVLDGLRNKEIADQLFVSEDTVKKHLYNTYQKLHVHSRIELVTKAFELELFQAE